MKHFNETHGHCRIGKITPTYRSWIQMRSRCNNSNVPDFDNYGGRGIGYCKRWESFENFLEDMGLRPDGKTLDRWPDNNGNYELSNCRWATLREQRVNSRPISCGRNKQRIFIAMNHEGTMIASNNQNEFARKYGLGMGNISKCLHGKLKRVKNWRFCYGSD